MKPLLISILCLFAFHTESKADPKTAPDPQTQAEKNHRWVGPDIGVRGILSLLIGGGLSGGVAFFDKRLAVGLDGYFMAHISFENHLGLYLRVVPLKWQRDQNIYLIGRVHRGKIYVLAEPNYGYWAPLHTYSYGLGATIGGRSKDTLPTSIELTCRTIFGNNFCLPGIGFGYIF